MSSAQKNNMKTPFKIKFLDMIIQDTGNGDGITLVGNDGGVPECSVGNFQSLKEAKIWATRWFMIRNPDVFGHMLWQRMAGAMGVYREFSKFKDFCASKNIPIPDAITHDASTNYLITCCGRAV